MRDEGSEEVKYKHLVRGSELSGNRCYDAFNPTTRSVPPQELDQSHSLENPPQVTEYGSDDTFWPYLREQTIFEMLKGRFYGYRIRLMNFFILVYNIRARPYDASGMKRVKRVIPIRNLIYKKSEALTKFEIHFL